jgi:UDP-glucose 4-epimerase
MNYLVTGGAGFIGSNICQLLLEDRHQVTVLDNLMSGHEANLHGLKVNFVRGDVRDADLVKKLAAGTDAIFHLAASVGNARSINFPVTDSEINVLGTLNVLEAARHAGVRKVVYSSSAGIFGELKTLPIREDHPVEPDTPYGATKLAAEKLCLAYAKLYGIEAVCLRYFNVFGPRQRFDAYGNVIPIFVFKVLRGEPITIFGDGEQTRDFINVRDVARANYAAASAKGVWGAFNLGSGTRITINHLVKLLQDSIAKLAPRRVEQAFMPAVNAARNSGALAPEDGPFQVIYGPKRPGDVRDSLADISKAAAELGFSPSVAMEEGLPEYVAWARQNVEVAATAGGASR